jgi:hypothetical protein
MKTVIQARGADERMHIFRMERPGLYAHYTRKIWEHTQAAEERFDNILYLQSEVETWLVRQYPPEPISPEEIAALTKNLPRNLGNGGGREP